MMSRTCFKILWEQGVGGVSVSAWHAEKLAAGQRRSSELTLMGMPLKHSIRSIVKSSWKRNR